MVNIQGRLVQALLDVMSLQRHSRCQPGQADGPCEWEWFVDSRFHFS